VDLDELVSDSVCFLVEKPGWYSELHGGQESGQLSPSDEELFCRFIRASVSSNYIRQYEGIANL
jgi:hypothetical protein